MSLLTDGIGVCVMCLLSRVAVRAAVHVRGRGARGHRLPRGAGAERAAAVPGGAGAAGRAGLLLGQADHCPHALQARRAGNPDDAAPPRKAKH